MDYKILLVLIGSFISIFSTILYILSILKGKIKPHTFSFLLWTILTFVGFFSSYLTGGGIGSIVPLVLAITNVFILILSFKYGIKELNLLDKVFLFLAFISIFLWYLTNTPFYSIILVTIIDFCGYIPTLSKISKYPDSEKIINWILFALANVLGVLALDSFSITTLLYPIMIIIMNLVIVIFILYFEVKK